MNGPGEAHPGADPAGGRPGRPEGAARALIGLDLVDTERFRRALERHPALEGRLFTPAEISYCRARAKPILHFAARFAAKEAVGKLLGTGVVSWQEIEVLGDLPEGGPTCVTLGARTAEAAEELGVTELRVSLSHVDAVAGACLAVIARSWGGTEMDGFPQISDDGDPEEAAGESSGTGWAGSGHAHTLFDRPGAFTSAQMREMDRATIEDIGVPGPC